MQSHESYANQNSITTNQKPRNQIMFGLFLFKGKNNIAFKDLAKFTYMHVHIT